MYCIRCGKQIVDDAAFCPYCGTKQETLKEIPYCPKCGKEFEEGFRFCHICGTPLEKKTIATAPQAAMPEENKAQKVPAPESLPDENIAGSMTELFFDLFAGGNNGQGCFAAASTNGSDVWGTLKAPFRDQGVLVDIYGPAGTFIETNFLQDTGYSKKKQQDQILLIAPCDDYPADFIVAENRALTDELSGYILEAFRHAISKAEYAAFTYEPTSSAWIALMCSHSESFAKFYEASNVNPIALSFMISVLADLAQGEKPEIEAPELPSTLIKEYKGVSFDTGGLLSNGMGKLSIYSDKLVFDFQYKNNGLLSIPLAVLSAKKYGFELPYYLVAEAEAHRLTLTSGANTTLTLKNGSIARFGFFSASTAREACGFIKDAISKLPANAAGKMTADEWINQFTGSTFDAPTKKR